MGVLALSACSSAFVSIHSSNAFSKTLNSITQPSSRIPVLPALSISGFSVHSKKTPSRRSTSSEIHLSVNQIVDEFYDPILLQHVATGGLLALAGDVAAQSLLSEKKSFPPEDWDKARTAAFVIFGAVYTGGVQHFIFSFLNESFDDPIKRLLLAQFFFIPFCYYPTFLASVPFLRAGFESEGNFLDESAIERQQDLFGETANKIPSTLLRNWCFWLPVQFFQFSIIPVDLQVTYCAAFGVIWNAILSWSTSSSSPVVTASPSTKQGLIPAFNMTMS